MHKKLYVISLGCDKNRVDTEEMLHYLSGGSFGVVQSIEDADIALINTCAFIESARKEAIETILWAADYKNKNLERLVVTGCLPQKYLAELRDELSEVDCFLGVSEYSTIAQKIFSLYKQQDAEQSKERDAKQSKTQQADDLEPKAGFGRILTTPDLFAYLKIADGCNNHCTFCTIPSIRGAYKSKPIEHLVAETRELIARHDTKEIILVAQDVTAYGKDIYGEYKLIELIKELSKTDIACIRLMYCYPELITPELIKEIAHNDKVAKYIDIPLQHVDDGILKLMNRRSNFDSIKSLIRSIRQADPKIAIRTTFMVGFPSETEQQFGTLYDFLQQNPLDHVGIFAYSLEEDTPSAKIKGHVSEEVKLERVERLGALHEEQTKQKNRTLIGTKISATYFDIDYDKNLFVARSQFDAPDIDSVIYFSSQTPVEFGAEYDLTITGIDGFDLIGELK